MQIQTKFLWTRHLIFHLIFTTCDKIGRLANLLTKAHPFTHQSHTRPQMIIMSLILNPSNSIPILVHTQNCLVDRQSTMRRLPDYRHFLDQQQQSDSHNDELYVGQRFCQLEDLKHTVKMWHIKNHVTFKAKRCVKDTWVLCCPVEGC